MMSTPRPPTRPKPYKVKFGLNLEEKTVRVLKGMASDDGDSCSTFIEKLVMKELSRRRYGEQDVR